MVNCGCEIKLPQFNEHLKVIGKAQRFHMQEQRNINSDFQELIDYCHSTAERLLLEQEEFYPFGAYLDNKGILTPVGFYNGDEFPLSGTVIIGLQESFQRRLKGEEISAYAITLDTRVKNKQFPDAIDAISIQITHRYSDEAINYYFPYKLRKKQIEFIEGWAEYAG